MSATHVIVINRIITIMIIMANKIEPDFPDFDSLSSGILAKELVLKSELDSNVWLLVVVDVVVSKVTLLSSKVVITPEVVFVVKFDEVVRVVSVFAF